MFGILKKRINNVAGKLSERLIPIKHEYSIGSGTSIAICTLSSMNLFEEIRRSADITNSILIVGRLLSENRGIDTIIRFTLRNTSLHYFLLCGKEVKGHKSGQTFMSLHKNGVDRDGRIIGAISNNPILSCSQKEIESFRRQIKIYNLIGIEDLKIIKGQLSDLISATLFNMPIKTEELTSVR